MLETVAITRRCYPPSPVGDSLTFVRPHFRCYPSSTGPFLPVVSETLVGRTTGSVLTEKVRRAAGDVTVLPLSLGGPAEKETGSELSKLCESSFRRE